MIFSKKITKKTKTFILFIFLLLSTSKSTLTSVKSESELTSIVEPGDFKVETNGKCYLETYPFIFNLLSNQVELFRNNLKDEKSDSGNLLNFIETVSPIYYYKQKEQITNEILSEIVKKTSNFVNSNKELQKFFSLIEFSVLKSYSNQQFEKVWNDFLNETIKSIINKISTKENRPFYFGGDLWRGCVYLFKKTVLSFEKENQSCVAFNYLKDFDELYCDMNNENMSFDSLGTDLVSITRNYLKRRRFTLSFFFRSALSFATSSNNIIFSLTTGDKLVTFKQVLSSNKKKVNFFLTVNEKTFVFYSNSSCDDLFFALINVEKTYSGYTFSLVIKSTLENNRQSVIIDLPYQYIEFGTFSFPNSQITNKDHIYLVQYVKSCESNECKLSITQEIELVTQLSDEKIVITQNEIFSKCSLKPSECSYLEDNSCSICMDNFYILNGKCLSSCPNGYFGDKTLQVCEKCKDTCETCSDANTCIKCKENYFYFEGNCIEKCPFNTYEVNRICHKCNDSCEICKSAEVCLKCKVGFLFQGKCIEKCYEGYFSTVNPNVCNQCSNNCSLCQDSFTCSQCKNNFYLFQSRCVDLCPEGTFPSNEKTCIKCTGECLKCKTLSQCTECSNGYNLFEEKCITECPVGTVPNKKNCIKCIENCDVCLPTDSNICTKCNKNTFLKSNSCVETCGEGFFSDQFRNCVACFNNCRKCNDSKSCIECRKGWLLLSSQCVEKCPAGFVQRNNECVECSKESKCKECLSSNLNICVTCFENSFLYKGKCISNCPASTFMIGNQCFDCKSECETCSNEGSCNTCKAGLYFKQNQCVKSCGEGYFPVSNICKPCTDQDCLLCSVDISICNKCQLSKVLYNGRCIENCPSGTYLDTNRSCIKCFGDCDSCQNPDFCIECAAGSFLSLDRKTCIKECPDFQVGFNKVCVQCKNSLCKKCSTDLVSCTVCPQGMFLYNKTCYTICPSDTFTDISKGTCVKCESPCLKCVEKVSKCTECIDNYVLNPNNQCLDNCPLFFANVDKVCKKCLQPDCEVCSKDLNTCSKCRVGSVLLDGKCLSSCPNGYFSFTSNSYSFCKQCGSNCKTCLNENECNQCNEGFSLFEKGCLEKCPLKFASVKSINNGNTCKSCPFNCNECNEINLKECLSCQNGSFLLNGDCRNICPTGYFSNSQSNTCQACKVSNCQSCPVTPDTCSKCESPKLLLNNRCIDSCPIKMRPTTEGSCVSCLVSNCDSCMSSLYTCDKCSNLFYQLNEKSCIESCPVGTYPTKDMKCIECNVRCESCSDGINCISCKKGFFLSKERICIDKCPNGQVGNMKTGKCEDCAENCDVCSPERQDQCFECSKDYYLYQSKCFKICPDAFWNNSSTRKCETCPTTCKTCKDQSTCITCQVGFSLYNNLCIDKCPEKTVEINGKCENCLTSSRCIKCSKTDLNECLDCGAFFLYDKSCEETCPLGTFVLPNKTCAKCISKCSHCKDSATCEKCYSPFVLLSNRRCAESCLDGQVEINGVCEECSQSNCVKCSTSKECSLCKNGYFLKNHYEVLSCVTTCGEGYYVFNNECKQCTDQKCLKCQGQNHCEVCKDSFLIDSKTCVLTCPEGTAPVNGQCRNCEKGCLKCDVNNINNCVECNKPLLLSNGDCLFNCPEGYVNLILNPFVCVTCGSNCKSCSNKDRDICNLCNDGYVLDFDFKCKLKCSDGYRQVKSNCIKCEINNCNSCPYEDSCIQCFSPFILSNDNKRCVSSCPIGEFPLNGQCKKCGFNCVSCDTKGNCIDCESNYFVTSTGKCNSNCVDGEVRQGDDCRKCEVKDCSKCNSNELNICLECKNSLFLYNNQCIVNCPSSTFITSSQKKCKDCKLNCVKCTNSNDCLQCSNGFVLQDNNCQSQCNDGYYNNNGICSQCSNNKCKKCSNNEVNSCVLCYDRYFLKEGVCVENCGSFWYSEFSNQLQQCKKCKESCKICIDSESCDVCDNKKVLFNSNCIDSCPSGYIPIEGKCYKCNDNNCNLCMNNLNTCISCKNDYALKDKVCVKDCGNDFFKTIERKCVPCDDKNCKDCSKTSKSECFECKENTVLYNSKCIDKCPKGWIENAVGTCVKCVQDSCNVCCLDALDRCVDCNYGFLHNGKCVEKCPESYFGFNKKCVQCQENCVECTQNSCLKCKLTWALDKNVCVQNCPDKTVNVDGKCLSCTASNCLYCENNLANCTKCEFPFLLLENKCVNKCPFEYFSNGISCKKCEPNCKTCENDSVCKDCNANWFLYNNDCLSKCPIFTYLNPTSNACLPCFDQENCEICDGNTPSICKKCGKTSILYNSKCFSSCPQGTFKPSTENTCLPCNKNCKSCFEAEKCTVCNDGFFIIEGNCIEKCPKGYVTIGKTCIKCGEGCETCLETNLQHCLSCNSPLNLYENRCISTCPIGSFQVKDVNNRMICDYCEAKCSICKSKDVCTICKNSYYLFNSQCYEKCPVGSFVNEQEKKCILCTDKNCKSCKGKESNNDLCEECKEGFFLYLNRCISKCPDGFYALNNKVCDECESSCRKCTEKSNCIECQSGFFFSENMKNTCISCVRPKNLVINNVCKSCKPKNCSICQSDNDLKCKECEKDYKLNLDFKCELKKKDLILVKEDVILQSPITNKYYPTKQTQPNQGIYSIPVTKMEDSDEVFIFAYIKDLGISKDVSSPRLSFINYRINSSLIMSLTRNPSNHKCVIEFIKIEAEKENVFLSNEVSDCSPEKLFDWTFILIGIYPLDSNKYKVDFFINTINVSFTINNVFNSQLVTRSSEIFFFRKGTNPSNGSLISNIYTSNFMISTEQLDKIRSQTPSIQPSKQIPIHQSFDKEITRKYSDLIEFNPSAYDTYGISFGILYNSLLNVKRILTVNYPYNKYNTNKNGITNVDLLVLEIDASIKEPIIQNGLFKIPKLLEEEVWYFINLSIKSTEERVVYELLIKEGVSGKDVVNVTVNGNENRKKTPKLYIDAEISVGGEVCDQVYKPVLYLGEVGFRFVSISSIVNNPRCSKYGFGFACIECLKPYVLSYGVCVDSIKPISPVNPSDIIDPVNPVNPVKPSEIIEPSKIFEFYNSYNNGINNSKLTIDLKNDSKYDFTITFSLRKLVHSMQSTYNLLSMGIKPVIQIINKDNYTTEFIIGDKKTVFDFGNVSFDFMNLIILYNSREEVFDVYIYYKNKSFKLTSSRVEYVRKIEVFDINGIEIGFEVVNGYFIPRKYNENEIQSKLTLLPKTLDPNCIDGEFSTGNCLKCKLDKPINNVCKSSFTYFKYFYNFPNMISDVSKANISIKTDYPFSVNADVYSLTSRFRISSVPNMDNRIYDIISLNNDHHLKPYVNDPSKGLISVKLQVKDTKFSFIIQVNTLVKPIILYPDFDFAFGKWTFFYGIIDLKKNTFDYTLSCKCKTITNSVKLENLVEKLQNVGSVSLFDGLQVNSPSLYGEFLNTAIIVNPTDDYYLNNFKDNKNVLPVLPIPIENCAYNVYNYHAKSPFCLECDKGFKLFNQQCLKEGSNPALLGKNMLSMNMFKNKKRLD